jgi:hypothetical protein
MKRIRTELIVFTFALSSALAIAQAAAAPPASQSTQTQPATTTYPQQSTPAQDTAQPSTTQPGRATSQPQTTQPATTSQPAQTPAQPGPTQTQSGQMPAPGTTNATGNNLSDPSMQAAPAPQGCAQKEQKDPKDQKDKDRARMRESCGYLLDASGNPAPNASLELVESGQQNAYLFVFARTLTDAQGRFDFGPVPSGHYLLRTAQNAPLTVYNFVSLDTQNADGQCKKPVEVKAAPAGQCNSEVRAGKGSFPTEMGAQTRSKGDTSKGKGQQKQP